MREVALVNCVGSTGVLTKTEQFYASTSPSSSALAAQRWLADAMQPAPHNKPRSRLSSIGGSIGEQQSQQTHMHMLHTLGRRLAGSARWRRGRSRRCACACTDMDSARCAVPVVRGHAISTRFWIASEASSDTMLEFMGGNVGSFRRCGPTAANVPGDTNTGSVPA